MLVSDIKAEVAEVIGQCSDDDALIYLTITRACELLANKRLIDPLIGYVDVTLPSASYYVALPREVKTPLKVNVNNNPAFSRSRLFEFGQNTDGSAEGERLGFQWSDRGDSPVQFPMVTPSVLNYLGSDPVDDGKTITITGRSADGVMHTETIECSSTSPAASTIVFATVETIVREATQKYATLRAGTDTVSIYQPVEIDPSYRFLRISKPAAALHIIYRKNVFTIESDNDIVPCMSPLAVIHACRAVRQYANEDYDKGDAALARSVMFLQEDQDSRDQNETLATDTEMPNAINADMYVADGIIVRDVYDAASDIFGLIGRQKLFDRIQMGIDVMENKAHWQSDVGVVDLVAAGDSAWSPVNCNCVPSSSNTATLTNGAEISGRQAVASGASSVTVVFATAFQPGFIPSVNALLQKASADDDDISVVSSGSVTETGCVFYLSATTGNANYILNWDAKIS